MSSFELQFSDLLDLNLNLNLDSDDWFNCDSILGNREEEIDENNTLIDEAINLTISACLGIIKLFENSSEYSEMRSLMYL